jgi:glycosyltransferase involved in cell wall biosynthesis
MTKVLFIVPYPVKLAPSQRFRVELFEPYLKNAGLHYKIAPFLSAKTWNILYKRGSSFNKIFGILSGFARRFKHVITDVPQYEYIFIHREAAPLGPPIFEWIIAKLWRKKIIYDFDDAIWIPNTSKENKLAGWFKANWKVKYICKWSYKVVGGNEYLRAYAAQFNSKAIYIPTCVDMARMHNKMKEHTNKNVVIGWTGSHSTLGYLSKIISPLQDLQKEMNVGLLVIANRKPELPLQNWEFIEWNEVTEISDLLKIDVGIMPLDADEWSEGKCGFKLIQYLSLGIPAIASPVGVNKTIIKQGINGYLCNTPEEWLQALRRISVDAGLRKQMGLAGHEKIFKEFSVQSQLSKFLGLFS